MTYYRIFDKVEYCYTMNGQLLNKVEYVEDLGVLFDEKISFNLHIQKISNEALKLLGFIYRNTKHFNSTRALDCLYNSYVRSKLEYASVVWCPYYTKYQLVIEHVQFKYLKLKYYLINKIYPANVSYIELVRLYDCDTLNFRRAKAQQIYLYKLLNNLVDDSWFFSLIPFAVPISSTRHISSFYLKTPRTNCMIRSPLYSMCVNHNKYVNDIDVFLLPLPAYLCLLKTKFSGFK